ncbi:anaerobic ribonucleoside-triphosphate reductase activating protein [Desulfogranum marinum]|uniref:anaerobic ribonucleoside-triphosphate reductase activating protein n=1 Tax=Desulfogranum marinum TaxID=453220 RepID=UPI001963B2AA|nr:anaerobic ribonucleoside-triphosphate reductase activating protein [Desulfogranum marinum]MBM9513777.1 anaerobic ribonucleoside-triphosphate reductase activating protein [Desulfogranum marinum]
MFIGGFQSFTLSDYPGKPAAIIFTRGCNFKCPYCHNQHLLRMSEQHSPSMEEGVLGFMEKSTGMLEGLVVTGGEPTLQQDLMRFVSAIKALGFAVKLDTNGSNPQCLRELLDNNLIDYIAMDVKAPFSKYSQLCGIAVDTEAIRESVDVIVSSGKDHHFRTTVYPALLGEEDIQEITSSIPETSRYVIQQYRPVPEAA